MTAKETATPSADPLTAFTAGMNRAISALSEGPAAPAKGLQAAAASFTAALAGAEKARSHLASAGARAIQDQLAAAAAFAKVKTPQEALELQAQFTGKALEAYRADLTAFGGLLNASVEETLKPFVESLGGAAQSASKA